MKKVLSASLIILACKISAQLGTNVYPFLNLPVSARQAALGGDAVSVRDNDVAFTAVNPALLNLDMDNHISANVALYLAGSTYGTLNYAKAFERGHLVSAHVRYMDYGKMPRTDEAGFENGQFGAMDASLGLGYAYQFEDEWTIGANVHFITSKIDTYNSMAVSADIGASYHFKRTNETIGLVFRNFGYQFKAYNGNRELLPFRVDLGYTKIMDKFPAALTITAHDLQKFDISSEYNNNAQEVKLPRKILDHFSFGAEFFPESAFKLRVGYNIKRGNELAVIDQRSFAGISAGFGVRFNRITVDYSHVRYHRSSNLNVVGIGINLSDKRY